MHVPRAVFIEGKFCDLPENFKRFLSFLRVEHTEGESGVDNDEITDMGRFGQQYGRDLHACISTTRLDARFSIRIDG